jgi:hypothetical protein
MWLQDLADLLVRLAERRSSLEEQIKNERDQPLRGTGWAFVSFTSKEEAALALEQDAIQVCFTAQGCATQACKTEHATEPE